MNLNAAVDKSVVVEGFRLNAIHRPSQVRALPGGKGCNVARALKTLGGEPVLTGWAGGYAGQFIAAGLQAEGIPTALVETGVESRTCLSVVDAQTHTVTEIYEPGEPVPPAAQAAFIEQFRRLLGGCQAVTLSGSLPPGVASDFYVRLIELAHQAGVPAWLDTSRAPLQAGLYQGRPFLVKPNRQELSELVDQPLASVREVAQQALHLSQAHGCRVVVSLGAEGAVAAWEGQAWQACPPPVRLVSAVGSGDALLAGLVLGFTQRFTPGSAPGGDLRAALRLGVAAGAANAISLGAAQFSREDVFSILKQVQEYSVAG